MYDRGGNYKLLQKIYNTLRWMKRLCKFLLVVERVNINEDLGKSQHDCRDKDLKVLLNMTRRFWEGACRGSIEKCWTYEFEVFYNCF